MKKLFLTFILVLSFVLPSYSATLGTVKDNNNGNKGDILINTGELNGKQNDIGTWVNPKDVPELKGEKGDKGDTGLQGVKGDTGEQGVAGTDGKDGLNGIDGQDGKDVDPTTVNNLQKGIDDNLTKVTNESTNRTNADKILQQNINNTNSRVDNLDNRVGNLEKTQNIIGAEVRVYDSKKVTVTLFADYTQTRQMVDRAGIRFTYKIGESYQDKEMKRLEKRIEMLEAK